MLTKKQIQQLKALENKKERELSGTFLAEGEKLVGEIVASGWPVTALYATADWPLLSDSALPLQGYRVIVVSDDELKRISLLKNPRYVVAVVNKPLAPPPSQIGRAHV